MVALSLPTKTLRFPYGNNQRFKKEKARISKKYSLSETCAYAHTRDAQPFQYRPGTAPQHKCRFVWRIDLVTTMQWR
jgi:hypothetical protein